ncbi:hypothetical protein D3C86_1080770 [compost metagenome]
MSKFAKDKLWLLKDFLEEKRDELVGTEYVGYEQFEIDGYNEEAAMMQLAIDVIEELIKE